MDNYLSQITSKSEDSVHTPLPENKSASNTAESSVNKTVANDLTIMKGNNDQFMESSVPSSEKKKMSKIEELKQQLAKNCSTFGKGEVDQPRTSNSRVGGLKEKWNNNDAAIVRRASDRPVLPFESSTRNIGDSSAAVDEKTDVVKKVECITKAMVSLEPKCEKRVDGVKNGFLAGQHETGKIRKAVESGAKTVEPSRRFETFGKLTEDDSMHGKNKNEVKELKEKLNRATEEIENLKILLQSTKEDAARKEQQLKNKHHLEIRKLVDGKIQHAINMERTDKFLRYAKCELDRKLDERTRENAELKSHMSGRTVIIMREHGEQMARVQTLKTATDKDNLKFLVNCGKASRNHLETEIRMLREMNSGDEKLIKNLLEKLEDLAKKPTEDKRQREVKKVQHGQFPNASK